MSGGLPTFHRVIEDGLTVDVGGHCERCRTKLVTRNSINVGLCRVCQSGGPVQHEPSRLTRAPLRVVKPTTTKPAPPTVPKPEGEEKPMPNRSQRGKPKQSKYTSALGQTLVDLVADGTGLEEAAKAVGLGKWRNVTQAVDAVKRGASKNPDKVAFAAKVEGLVKRGRPRKRKKSATVAPVEPVEEDNPFGQVDLTYENPDRINFAPLSRSFRVVRVNSSIALRVTTDLYLTPSEADDLARQLDAARRA